MAIRAARSADWPYGTPVRVEDLRAIAANRPDAKALLDTIQRTGRPLFAVLHDATRARVGSEPPVVRLPRRLSEQSYFDVPAEPGLDRRALYLRVRDMDTVVRDRELEALDEERRAALEFGARGSDPIVRAIAAVRALACWRELDSLREMLAELEAQSAVLPKRVRERLQERRAALQRLEVRWGPKEDAESIAAQALERYGVTPDQVLAAPRPLLTPSEYVEWLPERRRQGFSASLLMGRAQSLRRYHNPRFEYRQHPDPELAAVTCVDRVDALVFLAEQLNGRTYGFLRRGQRLLGLTLRDPTLAVHAAVSPDWEVRDAGLAALVLLGSPKAAELALSLMRDATADAGTVIQAFHALTVLRRVEPNEWPEHVRRPQNAVVRAAWVEVITAARDGRWLLQR
jgi:hypothetical protein